MKAVFLIRHGGSDKAFEIREIPIPVPGESEVRIRVQAFGLNFADVMARKGLYRDCPPLPCVIGYDAVGIIDVTGSNVTQVKVGDRVTCFTRFKGYAEYIVTDETGVAKISSDMPLPFAASLTTQCCTAWYCINEAARVHEGDHVLVHAAAGGVGSAIVQLLKIKEVIIYGTCGSEEKVRFLQEIGVHHPINYKERDYQEEIRKISGKRKLDVIIDSLGGRYVREGINLLGAGGTMVCIGGSQLTSATNFFDRWKKIFQFGLYHPGQLMMACKSLSGVNMLKLADSKPRLFLDMLQQIISLAESGTLQQNGGRVYHISEFEAAHSALENRQTMGKVVVRW
ncbi:MAG: zinc-binding dehydrogenase [Chitinophagales bacterium]|nr:zinc-binding dehydrogenase [Chitinophagales bacterium]